MRKATPAHTIQCTSSWGGQLRESRNCYQGATYIEYEDGSRINSDGSPHWKRCTHVMKEHYDFMPYTWTSYRADGSFAESGSFHPLFCNGSDLWNELYGSWYGCTAPTLNKSEVARGFMNEVYGEVKTGFLSLEDVAGLVGGKSIFKSARSAVESLINIVGPRRSFRQAAKDLAGLDLGRKFSVNATFNDVVKALDFNNTFESYRQKLRNRQDIWRLYKYSATQRVSTPTISRPASWPGHATWGQCYNTSAYTIGCTGLAQSTLYGWYKVHYPKKYFSRTNYSLKYYGLDKPLSTIWAIVPMSFVVDYFVSVQTILDELDHELNRSEVNVAQIGSNWVCNKTEVRAIASMKPGICGFNGGLDYPRGYHSGMRVELTTSKFERYPLTLPDLRSAWASTGALSVTQKTTLTELFMQLL